MDLVSGSFLVAIILLGGVIAYFADALGRKLGKKRLKFLGMRPRHTATFFTMAAGLAIPLLTVLFIAAVSSDARQWILEGRMAIVRATQLTRDVEKLNNEIKLRSEEVSRLEQAEKRATNEANKFRQEGRKLQGENSKLSQQTTTLKQNVSNAVSQMNKARSQFAATSRQLGQNLKALSETRQNLRSETANLDRVENNYQSLAKDWNDLNVQYQRLDRELLSLQRNIRTLDSSLDTLRKEKADLETQVADSKSALTDAQELLRGAREDLAATQQKLTEGQRELETIQNELQVLRAISDNSRTQPLIYAKGEEVARIIVPANLPNSSARTQVTRLLRVARVNAEALGARGAPSAGFFNREQDGRPFTPDQQLSEFVSQIAGHPRERVAIAVSLINTFKGEPVALDLRFFPNQLAFTNNELIAETRIDGDLPIAQIISRLVDLLAGAVKQKALERGMVPVVGREDSLGSVEPERVYDIVQQIKSESRNARVQVLADSDTYAGEPLRLILRIR